MFKIIKKVFEYYAHKFLFCQYWGKKNGTLMCRFFL